MRSTTETIESDSAAVTTLQHHWGWLLALGIVQFITGIIALAVPVVASLFAVFLFAWLLIAAAVVHIIHAFKVRKWPGFALHLIGGILYAAGGIVIFFFPLGGALTLTLVLATLFIAEGTLRSALAINLRGRQGWAWFLAGGMASIVLGVSLLLGWPASAVWAIGMLLGINLIFSGVMNSSLALTIRRAPPNTTMGSPLAA